MPSGIDFSTLILNVKKSLGTRRFAVLVLGMFLALAFLTSLVYLPLWKNLQAKSFDYRQEQERLKQIKQEAVLGDKIKAKLITSEDEIPQALDEMVRKARALGISFESMKRKDLLTLDKNYKILPISIEASVEFQGLAEFLGSLENLRRSVIVVNQLDISRDKELLPRLRANIELGMYLIF